MVSTPSNSEEKTLKNLQLSAQIALSLPGLLSSLLQEVKVSISTLLLSASRAHVVSDDAFAVDFRLFMKKHSLISELEEGKNLGFSDFSTLYSSVIASLGFLKVILLTEINPIIIADNVKMLPALLLPLIGLRNKTVSELSCHVFRLLLGRLDGFLPEESPEVSARLFDSPNPRYIMLFFHFFSYFIRRTQ